MVAEVNLEEEAVSRSQSLRPEDRPHPDLTRHQLAKMVVQGFTWSIILVLAAMVVAVFLGMFDQVMLNILTTVGTIWGGLTGAIVGFYFGKSSAGEQTGDGE